MPDEAIQAVQTGRKRCVFFTTHRLAALNSRVEANLASIYSMTEHILTDVYAALRGRIMDIHACADAVRRLDVLQSLATVWAAAPDRSALVLPAWMDVDDDDDASRRRAASRSVSVPGGMPMPLARPQPPRRAGPEASLPPRMRLDRARHPVLDQLFSTPVVPNDVAAGGGTPSVVVVSGPNGSGKSTLLTTTALVVIMAHVGAPVPCSAAVLRPFRAVFTRMGFDDDLAANASSFVVEMREAASILERAGPDTLVLIDELGRSTGPMDGAGVAWAILERLIAAGACCLFVTHMHELLALADAYPGRVLPVSMQVDVVQPPGAEQGAPGAVSRGARLRPLFAASSGTTGPVSGYGIAAAASVGLPRVIADAAWNIHAALEAKGAEATSARHHGRTLVRRAMDICRRAAEAAAAGPTISAELIAEAADLVALLDPADVADAKLLDVETLQPAAQTRAPKQPRPPSSGASPGASPPRSPPSGPPSLSGRRTAARETQACHFTPQKRAPPAVPAWPSTPPQAAAESPAARERTPPSTAGRRAPTPDWMRDLL